MSACDPRRTAAPASLSYSLRVVPAKHFINWQQDPQANYLARLVFPETTREFRIEVDLVAEMAVINPFDFFLEPYAEHYPFEYEPWQRNGTRALFQARAADAAFRALFRRRSRRAEDAQRFIPSRSKSQALLAKSNI